MTSGPSAREIASYWLGDSTESPEKARARFELWYRGGPRVDEEIRRRFGARIAEARDGALREWEETGEGALALVILLDQFTRNIYRGTPEAYSGDALALAAAGRAVAMGSDRALSVTGRIFLYHPFHHVETLDGQNEGVRLLEVLEADSPPEWRSYVRRSVEGFGRHRDVVARFGRFPHRNRVLGRSSTAAEREFLAANPESYGQGSKA